MNLSHIGDAHLRINLNMANRKSKAACLHVPWPNKTTTENTTKTTSIHQGSTKTACHGLKNSTY